jgi:hypothetical protein
VDIDQDREDLERLFWGVVKRYDVGLVPPGTESMGVPTALTHALAIVLHRQAVEVRAALKRVEGALPKEADNPGGQIDLWRYNPRITSIIRDEQARLDAIESGVDDLLREMHQRR